ncbi:MAG TPA: hypothetical protein VF543_20310 [Pyrinomonadaceae bacterium]|jgi:hypothetical protein
MSDPYEFEENLARASTPPARVYTDPRFLEEEKAKIFSRDLERKSLRRLG